MSSGYFGFTPGTTQFSAASYSARPAAGTAYVTYPAAAMPAYTYTPVVSAPAAAAAAAAGFATAFPAATVPRQEFTMSSTPTYYARPAAAAYYTPPTISAAPTVTAKPGGVVVTTSTPSTTYSGYEAVVYSYLQSKATGTSSQWLGLKRGGNPSNNTTISTGVTTLTPGHTGGRGSFKKNFSQGGTGRSQTVHYCDVCKISCAGPQTYREHLEGQKHKKKEAQVKSGQQPAVARTKTTYRCDLCGVTCTGQDTYQAHARGAKHQKTLKLHQTLGKPIPSTEPTIIPPSNKGGYKSGNKSGDIGLEFSGDDGQEADQIMGFEKDVEAVGGDYIEPQKSDDGKLISYFCKLCDCRFNDVNAKDMHLKGRRHRLQFKKKVNPDLEVEVKTYPRQHSRRDDRDWNRKDSRGMWNNRPMFGGMMGPVMGRGPIPLFNRNVPHATRGDTLDDRYLMAKHTTIYPTDDEINAIQRAVINTEKALKCVSDCFAEEEPKPDPKSANGAEIKTEVKVEVETVNITSPTTDSVTASSGDERLLKGVMRVGDLAKQLMLRGDLRADLVVLCSEKPTVTLLKKVHDLLPAQFATFTEDKYHVSMKTSDSALCVYNMDEPRIQITLTFTSVTMRDHENNKPGDPPDVLDKQKCLEALANLRRAKWFQARCTMLRSCMIMLRILKDLSQRDTIWSAMPGWALELLVEKVLFAANEQITPAEAFRHIFEAISTGLILPGGPSLLDPCEKDPTDALSGMSLQQKEDITANAQLFVRLIAFDQIYKILGIERLPADAFTGNGNSNQQRKRPLETSESVEDNTTSSTSATKKEKVENEEVKSG